MTSTAHTPPAPSPSPGLEPLRTKWGWIVALGVIYVTVGLIAIGSVAMATAASVLVVGIMMVWPDCPRYSMRSRSEPGANLLSGFFSVHSTFSRALSLSKIRS